MGYGIVHHFKGGTREQFEAVSKKVDPDDGSMVPGELFEASGASADGWVVMGIFESKEAWEKFRDGTLLPGLAEVGSSGFSGPPEEISFEVVHAQHREMQPSST
ncbi:MAG TPA: hypothetical protein VLO10_01285 [Candidatus Deferrimicrobium sp.]|nr:hypothetical protein [Candidatus Deferrimicrobium sp.]